MNDRQLGKELSKVLAKVAPKRKMNARLTRMEREHQERLRVYKKNHA